MASRLVYVLFLLLVGVFGLSAGYDFEVGGGTRGWVEPHGNETETYNQWAARNRFSIGDVVSFKYKDDSVLVVDTDDYARCNSTDPIRSFSDGNNTAFVLDRYGFFYFISGNYTHCRHGQKLIIRVLYQPVAPSPDANAPSPDSDDQTGSPSPSKHHKSAAARKASGLFSSPRVAALGVAAVVTGLFVF